MQYELIQRVGQNPTLSVFGSFGSKVITTTHPFFAEAVTYLTTTPEVDHDEDYFAQVLDPALHIGAKMSEVNPRVTYDSGSIYLDGVRLRPLIERHILERVEAREESWDRLIRFLIKVDENPSRKAQDAVYEWVTQHGIQITEDGDFVGYKGVQPDGLSKSAGPNNYIDGVLYGTPGKATKVPHEIGTVISKKRADVDDDTRLACSTGLHVGTHAYATNFGERLLTVKVNPRDVVSVPSSESTWKIRVCRYEVIALNADKAEFSGYTYDTEPESPEETDYDHEQARDEAWDEFHKDDERTETVSVTEPGSDEPLTDEERAELAAVVEADRTAEVSDDDFEREEGLDPQEESQIVTEIASSYKTLGEAAEAIPSLKVDLSDVTLGHKELARKWVEVTTESSVRRYRKAHGIKPRSAVRKLLG